MAQCANSATHCGDAVRQKRAALRAWPVYAWEVGGGRRFRHFFAPLFSPPPRRFLGEILLSPHASRGSRLCHRKPNASVALEHSAVSLRAGCRHGRPPFSVPCGGSPLSGCCGDPHLTAGAAVLTAATRRKTRAWAATRGAEARGGAAGGPSPARIRARAKSAAAQAAGSH